MCSVRFGEECEVGEWTSSGTGQWCVKKEMDGSSSPEEG